MANGSQSQAVQGDTFVLRFVSGKYEGTERILQPGDELVVGRAKNLGLVLVEDKVSRRHARIINDTGAIIVEDLGSTNGTFVNGERITTAALKEGDRLLVGTSVATITRVDPDHVRDSTESMAAPPAPEPADREMAPTHSELPAVPPATQPPPPPPSSVVGAVPDTSTPEPSPEPAPAPSSDGPPPPPPASEPVLDAEAPPSEPSLEPAPATPVEDEPPSAPPVAEPPPAASAPRPVPAEAAPATPPGDRRTDPGRRTASVSGFIEEVALPDLLQLLSAGRKTGVLYVHGQREAEIYLRGGQIENCRVTGSTTSDPQKLLYRVMNWREGQFELSSGDYDDVGKEIAMPTQELILEAARQADELGDLAASMPPLDAELMVNLPLEAPLRDLTPEQLDTLQFIYNHGRVETVLDKAPGTDLETYQHMAHLLGQGYVKIA